MTTDTCSLTPSISAAWDELADAVGAAPFLRPQWFAIWCDAFSRDDLTLFCARRDGQLVGVLPLLAGRTLRSPTNVHTPFFDVLATDPQAATALADAVIARRPRRVLIELCNLESAATSALVDRAGARGYGLETQLLRRLAYIDASRSLPDYMEHLGTRMLSDLRRQRRRLDAAGAVTLEVNDGTDALDACLNECFRLEASGWKGRQGTAIASDARTHRFYTEIAHWLADRGWLELCVLRLDGRAIAFDINICVGGVYYGFKSGYDEEFRRFGPGKLLTMDVVEGIFSRGFRRYDFLGDADDYKLRWCDATEARVRATMFAPTVVGRVERLAFRHGLPLAKRVRRAITRGDDHRRGS